MAADTCWILRWPDGQPVVWNEGIVHNEHRAGAENQLEMEHYDLSRGVVPEPVQLDTPCVLATCAACGSILDSDAFPEEHFPDFDTARRQAAVWGWSVGVDGKLRCEDCPGEPAAAETGDGDGH